MRIELLEIGDTTKISNAFGVSDEEDEILREEVLKIDRETTAWTESIKRLLVKEDTDLLSLYKMLLMGQLMGQRSMMLEGMK